MICAKAPEQPKAYIILTTLYILKKNRIKSEVEAMTRNPAAWAAVSSNDSSCCRTPPDCSMAIAAIAAVDADEELSDW